MAALAVFAVVVDMLHIALQPHVPLIVATGMTLLETAGELGVMTAVAISVFGMAVRSGPAGPDRTLADRSRPEPTGW